MTLPLKSNLLLIGGIILPVLFALAVLFNYHFFYGSYGYFEFDASRTLLQIYPNLAPLFRLVIFLVLLSAVLANYFIWRSLNSSTLMIKYAKLFCFLNGYAITANFVIGALYLEDFLVHFLLVVWGGLLSLITFSINGIFRALAGVLRSSFFLIPLLACILSSWLYPVQVEVFRSHLKLKTQKYFFAAGFLLFISLVIGFYFAYPFPIAQYSGANEQILPDPLPSSPW